MMRQKILLCYEVSLKKKWMHKCWEDGRDFYYMDTGYFGNETNTKQSKWLEVLAQNS